MAVAALPSGDYQIPGGILVERKTVLDLHGSIERQRFFRQIGRIRDEAPFPYLLVEGANVFRGRATPTASAALCSRSQIRASALIRSLDVTDTSLWLHRLAVREQRRRRAVDRSQRIGFATPAWPHWPACLASRVAWRRR